MQSLDTKSHFIMKTPFLVVEISVCLRKSANQITNDAINIKICMNLNNNII